MGKSLRSMTYAAAVALASVAVAVAAPVSAQEQDKQADAPAPIYLDMRNLALGLQAAEISLTPQAVDEPYGIVMDMDFGTATVTLVSFASGDASIYFSTGGGIVGAGQSSDAVAQASRQFVASAQPFVAAMQRTGEHPLPGPGEVRFSVITQSGIYAATSTRQALEDGDVELAVLYRAGQEAITQIRLAVDQREQP